MLESKLFLYVGFMCHQVIEKLPKAVLVQLYEGDPPCIHSLFRLARKGDIYERLSEEQKDFIDYLEPMNIEARYPTQKEKIMKALNKEKCEHILHKTKELSVWIKDRLYE